METITRYGESSYAGKYRLVYCGNPTQKDCLRYLQIRVGSGWKTIEKPIPSSVRGCYQAAQYLGV